MATNPVQLGPKGPVPNSTQASNIRRALHAGAEAIYGTAAPDPAYDIPLQIGQMYRAGTVAPYTWYVSASVGPVVWELLAADSIEAVVFEGNDPNVPSILTVSGITTPVGFNIELLRAPDITGNYQWSKTGTSAADEMPTPPAGWMTIFKNEAAPTVWMMLGFDGSGTPSIMLDGASSGTVPVGIAWTLDGEPTDVSVTGNAPVGEYLGQLCLATSGWWIRDATVWERVLPIATLTTPGGIKASASVSVDADGVATVSTDYAATNHSHTSSEITDASAGGNGAEDAGKLVKFGTAGNLYAKTSATAPGVAINGETTVGTGLYGYAAGDGSGAEGWSETGVGMISGTESGENHHKFGYSGSNRSFVARVLGAFGWFRGVFNLQVSAVDTLTANRVQRFQDEDGIVALTSDVDAVKSGPFENWVFEGDSWTAGTAQGNNQETYPYYINALVGNRVNVVDVATSGQTAATMVGTFAAQVAPHLTATAGKPSIAFIFAGINDVGTNDATAVSTLRDNLRLLWVAARTAGAKVCAFTLPHRTTGGGWTQANWKTINDNIIADSSYHDYLVRTDIIFNNATSSDYTDGLHVNTTAHSRFAGQVLGVLLGKSAYPSLPSDLVCTSVSATTFAANITKAITFNVEAFDKNSDGTAVTIGSDTNVKIFTAPVNGTYEIDVYLTFGTIVSGDLVVAFAYVVPIATGVAVEHRIATDYAAGVNKCVAGKIRVELARGDYVYVAAATTKANATLLINGRFSLFAARLVSIP